MKKLNLQNLKSIAAASVPTPPAWEVVLFADTDDKIKLKNSGGIVVDLSLLWDVTKVWTPANNQLGIWTGDGTLEGDSTLTYDGSTLLLWSSGKILWINAWNAHRISGRLYLRDTEYTWNDTIAIDGYHKAYTWTGGHTLTLPTLSWSTYSTFMISNIGTWSVTIARASTNTIIVDWTSWQTSFSLWVGEVAIMYHRSSWTTEWVARKIATSSWWATNLGFTPSATDGIVTSDTGTDATIPLATGTNSGLSLNNYTTTEKNKVGFITITQAVDLDTIESDTATNNSKVSNATHTWDVTGATALTIDKTAITWKTAVTAVWTDYVLISDTSDSGNLKKALASDFAWGGGVSDGDKWDITVASSGTVWTLDEPAIRKSETSVNNSPLFYTLNKFDSLQTNFYGTGTVALDTTVEAEGTGCMKLTLATAWNCWPRLTLSWATNFLKKSFSIKCRWSVWANISTAEILFATEAWFSNYYLWQWKGGTNGKLVTPPDGEWIERVFNPWDCAVGAGTPNWWGITHIIIRAQASTWTPDLYVDDFKYFACTQKPIVCVTFDDSLSTQFSNGKAKLDQYNIKGTFYCIWDLIGTATYMTQTEVDILSVQWHDISGHGQTNLTSLSSADQITDLRGMKKWLVTGGYRGSNNYALPNGAYTDAVLTNVRKYFNSIANIDWLSNTKEYSPNYLINRFSPDSWTSTATIQAWIDNAIANNNMAIIAWHWIVPSGATWAQVNQATYDTIMDYIGTKKTAGVLDTCTLTDYYAKPIETYQSISSLSLSRLFL